MDSGAVIGLALDVEHGIDFTGAITQDVEPQLASVLWYNGRFFKADSIVFNQHDEFAVATTEEHAHTLGLAMLADIGEACLHDAQYIEIDILATLLLSPFVLQIDGYTLFLPGLSDAGLYRWDQTLLLQRYP